MRIRTWRLALTGGVVVILAAVGVGLVAAAAPSAPAQDPVAAAPALAPGATPTPSGRPTPNRLEGRPAWGARLLRLGRHLVHVEATVTDRNGKLVVLWLDHGTVQSVGAGTVTVSETGGGARTMSTDDATIVHVGREDGTLTDVTAGDEVFVQSRVDGGQPLAKRILIIPARPS